jgi:hypothetical protein
MTYEYNYPNSGYYPSSCPLLKQRFGDWILSSFLAGISSVGPNRPLGTRTISIYLGQLNRFHLKTERELSLRTVFRGK